MLNERFIPEDAEPYAKSPLFNSKTVPDKLLHHHDLKGGTWGKLYVQKGKIDFFLGDDTSPLSVLYENDSHVILPIENHYIQVSDDAEFYIEFYKQPKLKNKETM